MESKTKDSTYDRLSAWLKRSFAVKLIVVLIILLLMMIPQSMVTRLVWERQNNASSAEAEVSQMWGAEQQITGPYLQIPYRTTHVNSEGEIYYSDHKITLMPAELRIEGTLADTVRQRGIFEVILYTADLDIEGSFDMKEIELLTIDNSVIMWEQAAIHLEISDLRGIDTSLTMSWNQEEIEYRAGIPGSKGTQGVHSMVRLDPGIQQYDFSGKIILQGTKSIHLEPVGKENHFHLRSQWASKKFSGHLIPDRWSDLAPGFEADWHVLSVNRNYPQVWSDKDFHINYSAVGVELIKPVDHYLKNHRATRYSFLVVAFLFLVYFFFEIGRRISIHPMSYILVGLNMSLFFLVLLALSEHMGFNQSYWIAASAHVIVVCLYSMPLFKNLKAVGVLMGLMIFIFGYIYVLLQLESYALLVGAIGIFVILSFVMLASRRIDWYNLHGDE